jgi:hypothetical protein
MGFSSDGGRPGGNKRISGMMKNIHQAVTFVNEKSKKKARSNIGGCGLFHIGFNHF